MKRKIFLLSTVALLFFSLVAVECFADSNTQYPLVDVAVNKPVYVSSEKREDSTVFFSGAYVVDNIEERAPQSEPKYSSFWSPNDDDSSPYVIVDLTKPYPVHRIDIQVRVGNVFHISASEDKDDVYKSIESHSHTLTNFENYLNVEVSDKTPYRYFKIEISKGSAEDIRIYDFKAYAPFNTNLENIATDKDVYSNSTETDRNGTPNPDPETKTPYITNNDITDYSTYAAGLTPRVTIDLGEQALTRKIKRVEFTARGKGFGHYARSTDILFRDNIEFWASDIGGEKISTAEQIQTDAGSVKLGEYKRTGYPFGPPWSTIAFDTDITNKRYITLIGSRTLAEIRVFAEISTSEQNVSLENIVDRAETVGPDSDSAMFLIDNNIDTYWTTQSTDSYAMIDLGAYYNVRKVGVTAHQSSPEAKSNFAVYGGSNSSSNGNDYTLLAVQSSESYMGDTFEQNVLVSNATRYIILKPTNNAAPGQKFSELMIYAEQEITLNNIALNKTSSVATINNGAVSSSQQPLPEGPANAATGSTPPSFYIDLGENPQPISMIKIHGRPDDQWHSSYARSFKIMGSNNLTNRYEELVRVNNQTMPIFSSITFSLPANTVYRYIAVVKDTLQFAGGSFNYYLNTTDLMNPYNSGRDPTNNLSLPEILIFAKGDSSNLYVPDIRITSISFADANGNPITDLSGHLGAQASFKNNTDEATEAVMMLALFNTDGIITSFASKTVALDAGQIKTDSVALPNSSESIPPSFKLKVFFWRSLPEHGTIILHRELEQGGGI